MIEIDGDRFRDSFETYSSIGATEQGGLHRLALTDEDQKARDRFVSDLQNLGLDIRIDEIGNIFGRREGVKSDADPVLIGSHLDSQPHGGRFDGQLGVLTALETIRTLEEKDIETERPIEIVNWTNEEGSRFQHAMLGSAVFVGELDLQTAYSMTDTEEICLEDELKRIKYKGDQPACSHDYHAYLELHIEQGPQLADHGKSVGVVDGVFGIRWLKATVHGETNHAGPTPMHSRRDAVAAAADAVSEINCIPNRLSTDAVTTVGQIEAEPNSINVVPNRAEFTIDIRSADHDVVQEAAERAEAELAAACERHKTMYDLNEVWESSFTEFATEPREAVVDAAAALDIAHEHLVSGAGHDAKYLTQITPAGMVFVPSVDGMTHNESEFTEWDDCVAGANVYTNATLSLARYH
jgi:N-carbamoyl-L-amino-acid hydrolase